MWWDILIPPISPLKTRTRHIRGGADVFVTKLSSSGSSLVYSTYLGGGGGEESFGIALGASGAAYVTGRTSSTDFPTFNPYQGTFQGGWDAFVTKLSSSGNSLVYSTYLGGSGNDFGQGIAVDASGAAYVTGRTYSSNFPTLNPYQGTFQGGWDAFVTKLSSSGDSLVYSTYLGGASGDIGMSIAVDGSGSAYVTGITYSSNFPTLNQYQGTFQGFVDAFVTKFSSSGTSLVYSTYLGGGSYDEASGIAVDASGAAYVTGITYSTDFPTFNPYLGVHQGGGYDAFVTKFSSSGTSLVYSTYLGGNNIDAGYGIAVDASGAAYVTGITYSTDFPTFNPYLGVHQGGGYDAFVTKLSSSGNNLVYSTYLGGSSDEYGTHIAVDTSGAAYVAGYTNSTDFPTENPYQTDQVGEDVFVVKFGATCCGLAGDFNGDGANDIADLSGPTSMVAFMFMGGPPPPCAAEGDFNGDGIQDVSDLSGPTSMVAYLFQGGPPPVCGPPGP